MELLKHTRQFEKTRNDQPDHILDVLVEIDHFRAR